MYNKMNYITYANEKAEKRCKIPFSFGAFIVITLIVLIGLPGLGFCIPFTIGSWILAFVIGSSSREKIIKKYIKKHQKALEEEYLNYSNLIDKRNQAILKGIPTCPHCASEAIEVFTDIRNSFSGRFEYGKPKMVCKICGKVFNPGE